MEKDAYYFPHFCNARHDRKIKRVRKELGIEGYAIFFMLLEVLREQLDYRYPMKDLDLLAEEFGTSEQKIRIVVCNYQLFELDEKEQFFSPKLFIYMQPYLNMKEQRRLAGIKSGQVRKQKLIEQPLNNRSATVEQPLNENEQSKVKESKVKESKNYIDDFFESVWILYPKKEGKGQVSKTQKQKLYKIGYDKIKNCIDCYKKAKEDTDKKFLQNGSTFFNSGYVDYLDVEVKPQVKLKPILILDRE